MYFNFSQSKNCIDKYKINVNKNVIDRNFNGFYFSKGARGLNVGGNAGPSRSSTEIPPFPGKERMPMNLLLHPLHFEQLFTLMQTLSDLRINGLPHPKAQILSRRVWDILMLLPTNPTVKEKLQNLTGGKENFTCKYCGKVNFKDF